MELNFENLKYELRENMVYKSVTCPSKQSTEYKDNILFFMDIYKHFRSYCKEGVITSELLQKYRKEFKKVNIFYNKDCYKGKVFADSGIIEVGGNAFAYACKNAEVRSFDEALIVACDDVKVYAFGKYNKQYKRGVAVSNLQ